MITLTAMAMMIFAPPASARQSDFISIFGIFRFGGKAAVTRFCDSGWRLLFGVQRAGEIVDSWLDFCSGRLGDPAQAFAAR